MTTALIVAGITLIGVFALFAGLQFFMLRRMRQAEGKPAPALDGEVGALVGSGGKALFYFFSPQCGACRAMTPVVKRLADEREGVFPIDVSRDLTVAQKFGIMATPTVILVDGGVVHSVLVGAQPESRLQALLG